MSDVTGAVALVALDQFRTESKQARAVIEVIFTCNVETITELCERMTASRRTIGRWMNAAGVPPADKFLQLAKLLRAAYIQSCNPSYPVAEVARRAGFPDPSTYAKSCARLFGLRPSDFRDLRMCSTRALCIMWQKRTWKEANHV